MVGGLIVASIVIFALAGYAKGLIRQIVEIGALVCALVLARPIGALIPDALAEAMSVPLLLRPALKTGLGGILVLIAAGWAGRAVAYLLMAGKPKKVVAKEMKEDRARGAWLGGIKGLLVALLVLIVVYNLGQVAEMAEGRVRARYGVKEAGKVRGSGLRRFLSGAKSRIDRSATRGLVRMGSPVDDEAIGLLDDVIDIANDPEALKRLLSHPDLQEIMRHPKIAGLAQDADIVNAAKERELLEIMNSDKVTALVSDAELRKELRRVDVKAIIKHARGEGR